MPRTRTTPEVKPSVAVDSIEQFGVEIAYNPDGSIDNDNTQFTYRTQHRTAEGAVLNTNGRSIPFAEWGASIKADLKAVYLKVLVDAENQGIIGAGTDTDDL